MRWPNFESLQRDLATENIRPKLVTLPGEMETQESPLTFPAAPRRLVATPQAVGNTPTPQTQSRRSKQVQEHNPSPAPQMQIGPMFRIRTAIDAAAADGLDTPQTDNGRHFYQSYHLEGACNTHCGGRNLHRPLSQSEFGTLEEWWDRYYGISEEPPVREVATGS